MSGFSVNGSELAIVSSKSGGGSAARSVMLANFSDRSIPSCSGIHAGFPDGFEAC